MSTTTAIIVLSVLFVGTAGALAAVIVRRKVKKGSPPAAESLSSTNSLELATVFDSITDQICIIDREFRVQQANRRYLQFTGALNNRTCYGAFWNRESICDNCPARETLTKGEPTLRKKFVLRRGDDHKHLEISAYPIFDKNNRIVRIVEYIRDMTQETNMLDQLIRSEKLAGIGVMTTGIAHEMNNALSGIAGTASNLLTMPEKFGLNEKGISRVFSILDSATRATGVMKNLLQFSSPLQDETRVMVNVKQLLKKVLTAVFAQEAPAIERKFSFDDTLPPIKADLSKLELVFINIIANGIRSIQQKAAREKRENREFRGVLDASARLQDKMVLITVTDNGIGIPDAIRTKIFDPFFSTWPDGKSTGLGLSTAMHLVEEHDGRIFFESTNERTTFSIQLPIDRSRLAPLSAKPSGAPSGTGA